MASQISVDFDKADLPDRNSVADNTASGFTEGPILPRRTFAPADAITPRGLASSLICEAVILVMRADKRLAGQTYLPTKWQIYLKKKGKVKTI